MESGDHRAEQENAEPQHKKRQKFPYKIFHLLVMSFLTTPSFEHFRIGNNTKSFNWFTRRRAGRVHSIKRKWKKISLSFESFDWLARKAYQTKRIKIVNDFRHTSVNNLYCELLNNLYSNTHIKRNHYLFYIPSLPWFSRTLA